MLMSRASTTALRALRIRARGLATDALDAGGIRVAALDAGQPTAAVALRVRAGSRHAELPGVAHLFKDFAFKSTHKRSALGTVREAELYGGVLSSTLSREHITLTAEFLRGDEEFFVDVLASFLTGARITQHELDEHVRPGALRASAAAHADAGVRALELAHALAFRSGLGAPLFAPARDAHALQADAVRAFAAGALGAGNVAVLGVGVAPGALARLLAERVGGAAALRAGGGALRGPAAAAYHGGAARAALDAGGHAVFVGFGAAGAPGPALAVLAAHLSPARAVKWGAGLSPLAGAGAGAAVEAVLLPYTDAALFGLLVRGESAGAVGAAAKAAVGVLREAAGLEGAGLRRAVAKAKFGAASRLESREGVLDALAAQAFGETHASLEKTVAGLDKMDGPAFAKATAALLKAKPTYVAVGDIQRLPYPDELGL